MNEESKKETGLPSREEIGEITLLLEKQNALLTRQLRSVRLAFLAVLMLVCLLAFVLLAFYKRAERLLDHTESVVASIEPETVGAAAGSLTEISRQIEEEKLIEKISRIADGIGPILEMLGEQESLEAIQSLIVTAARLADQAEKEDLVRVLKELLEKADQLLGEVLQQETLDIENFNKISREIDDMLVQLKIALDRIPGINFEEAAESGEETAKESGNETAKESGPDEKGK